MSIAKIIIKTLGKAGKQASEKIGKTAVDGATKLGKVNSEVLSEFIGVDAASPFTALKKIKKGIKKDLPVKANKVSFYKIENNPLLESTFENKNTEKYYKTIVDKIKKNVDEFPEYDPYKGQVRPGTSKKSKSGNEFWLKKDTIDKYAPDGAINLKELESILERTEDELTELYGKELAMDVLKAIGGTIGGVGVLSLMGDE